MRIRRFIWFLPLVLLMSCGIQHKFATKEESLRDSSYVYTLPYPEGKKRLLIQGYRSRFSHRGRLALDFKMKKGSPVTAARDGVVVGLQEGFTKGGLAKKYLRKANNVIIRHRDGSQAFYGHLSHNGVVVNTGDSVKVGQLIAYSGNTGYSLLPHLHFIVWGPTPRGRSQLPTRFYTTKDIRYLKPGKRYKSVSDPKSSVHTARK